MFSNLATLAIAVLAASAQALNESTSYRYNIDPDSVDQTFKNNACIGQNTVCQTVCYNGVSSIYCNTTTLVWNCECHNAPTPDLTKFNQTVPFYECQQYISNCVNANAGVGGNKTMQQKCLKIQCGGMDASKYAASATAPAPAPKPSKSASSGSGKGKSGPGSGSNPPSSGKKGGNGGNTGSGGNGGGSGSASALGFGESYGLAILVATGLFMFGLGIGL